MRCDWLLSLGKLVGARGFEHPTPCSRIKGAYQILCLYVNSLYLSGFVSQGRFQGILSLALQSFELRCYFAVQDVGIAKGSLDIGMTQGALHKLEVACLA